MTSQAIRSVDLARGAGPGRRGPRAARSSATSRPSARRRPAPPSVVARPPIPSAMSRIPASSTARRRSPVPWLVARDRVALGPARRATARTPSPSRRTPPSPSSRREPRGADRPAERVVRLGLAPRPAAGRLDRDERALAAVRERREPHVVVRAAPAASPAAIARATSTLVSEPLNESGAIRTAHAGDRGSRQRSVAPLAAVASAAASRRFSRYSGMRIIGGRSWSASSLTSSDRRPRPERGSFIVEPSSANRRARRRSSSRFITAWRITNDIRDSPSSSWFRCTRRSRSTWPRPLEPRLLGRVDQVPDLHRVAREERDLLEERAAARRTRRTAAG